MKKILLVCASGMSTSILMKKMNEAIEKKGYDFVVEAHAVAQVKEKGVDADVILLAPQISFQLKNVKEMMNCPVELVNMSDYGMMNGDGIIEHVKGVVGE